MTDEFVRVRNPNGYESTLSAAFVETIKGEVEVLDEPATNSWGRPLPATRRNGRPAKVRTSVKDAAAKKAAAESTTGGSAANSPEEGTE